MSASSLFSADPSDAGRGLRVRRNGGRWEAWVGERNRPPRLAATVGVELASLANRNGQDLVGALFDQAQLTVFRVAS